MIERALNIEKLFLMDYKEKIAYIRDIRAMLDDAYHDEGIKLEGKYEVASNLLQMGNNVDKIVLTTGLS